MNSYKNLKCITLVLIVGLISYGCDNSTDSDSDILKITQVNIIDRDTNESIVHTHGSGDSMNWHGSLPHLHPDEELEVNIEFLDLDDEPVSLGGEYAVQARLTEDSDDDVVELNNHGDHINIEAIGEGEVKIIFSLWHDGHSEFGAPPIELEIEGDDH